MQILHYCTHLELTEGGIGRDVFDLTVALSTRVKSVSLMSTRGRDWPTSSSGVQTMQTGSFDRSSNRFTPRRLSLLKQHIEASDVLHLHTPWEPATLQLAKLARKCDTPYVLSTHGMLELVKQKKSFLKKRLLFFSVRPSRNVYDNAAAVHCSSKQEADYVKRWFPRANVKVVPFVFDPSEYLHPPPTSDPDKHWPIRETPRPIVLLQSKIDNKKDIECVISSASEVCKTHNVRFIITGSSNPKCEQSLRALIDGLELQNHIEVVGHVHGDRKIALLRAADIFAVPTNHQSMDVVHLEAMACGLPIITTKSTDIWSEIDANGGALVIQEDVESTAGAILRLLEDTNLQKQMGKAGRKWITETYANDTIVNKYVELYRQVITQ